MVAGNTRGQRLQRLPDGPYRVVRHASRLPVRLHAPQKDLLRQARAAALTRSHPRGGARDGHILPHLRRSCTLWMGRQYGEADAAQDPRTRSCRRRRAIVVVGTFRLLRDLQPGIVIGIALLLWLVIIGLRF